MARFPQTLGDLLAAQARAGRDLETTALGVPELAPISTDHLDAALQENLTTGIDTRITTAINDANALPITSDRFTENSLSIWPFIHGTIPKGAFDAGSVTGADLEDFSIAVKKFKDDRHRLY